MIQFNLLPDVKLQYIKARRTQRLVVSISTLLIAVSLFVFIVLIGTVDVFQKKNLNDLNSDIKNYSSQLQNTPNLNKILTVQNQLQSLTTLHDQKPAATRLFGYLKQLTPAEAAISQLTVNFSSSSAATPTLGAASDNVSITGSAKAISVLNAFTDTLKFTKYQKADGTTSAAFSNVVLADFSDSSAGVTYTINANFDPEIFNGTDNVSLNVPNIISTRSVVDQPTDLFQSTQSNTGGH